MCHRISRRPCYLTKTSVTPHPPYIQQASFNQRHHFQYPDPRELADGSRPKRSLWDSRNDQHHIQENPTSLDNDCYFHSPRCPRPILGTSVPSATPPWRSRMPLHMHLPWPLLPTHLWPLHALVFKLLKTMPGHVVFGLDYSGIANNPCLLV